MGKGLKQGSLKFNCCGKSVEGRVEYYIPSTEAIEKVRSGVRPVLTTKEKHTRECYVVLAEGADAEAVKQAIVTMPDYFADYDTTVNFIDEVTLAQDHQRMPHGGFVIRSGNISDAHK